MREILWPNKDINMRRRFEEFEDDNNPQEHPQRVHQIINRWNFDLVNKRTIRRSPIM